MYCPYCCVPGCDGPPMDSDGPWKLGDRALPHICKPYIASTIICKCLHKSLPRAPVASCAKLGMLAHCLGCRRRSICVHAAPTAHHQLSTVHCFKTMRVWDMLTRLQNNVFELRCCILMMTNGISIIAKFYYVTSHQQCSMTRGTTADPGKPGKGP